MLGISWSLDPVSLIKLKILLTRGSGGDWSAAVRVATQHSEYKLLGTVAQGESSCVLLASSGSRLLFLCCYVWCPACLQAQGCGSLATKVSAIKYYDNTGFNLSWCVLRVRQ